MASPSPPSLKVPTVTHVGSLDEFEKLEIKARADSTPLVLKFSAVWCGPCVAIAPLYASQAEKYSDAIFLHVDVDECPALVERFNIAVMPTFIVVKATPTTATLDTIKGGNPSRLEAFLATHLGPTL